MTTGDFIKNGFVFKNESFKFPARFPQGSAICTCRGSVLCTKDMQKTTSEGPCTQILVHFVLHKALGRYVHESGEAKVFELHIITW